MTKLISFILNGLLKWAIKLFVSTPGQCARGKVCKAGVGSRIALQLIKFHSILRKKLEKGFGEENQRKRLILPVKISKAKKIIDKDDTDLFIQ